ncbi:LPXTG-motif cell wall-anchored protein [Microbacteriaceae bacterium SG_E_30_P1]|uniref:LPXTG-motif cell wall-anchored protein n=1 Tax=Antiquaquibacter oligotrophicus TaxID=2880260 RepID=A0ABT6KK52_9MICO|nr:LPXTG cell wall anchor domain-containing protein [Antiquaquibacter oligotrophicus]MDH6180374.1 LPXTG-motif cell wall-anchored protein [Antiquaquibacter oligotrophicus]UDF13884.1 LPXTG cell wall anchor domain-containing protein [Antiquaquibacter oligotrophicus]
MKSTRIVLVAALSLGLVALAAPAHAAPPALPAGEHLVATTCDSETFPDLGLFEVDAATGTSTQLASADGAYCGYQGGWDRVTHKFYFTTWDASFSVLHSYDPATNSVTTIGDITAGDEAPNVYSLVVSLDGKGYFVEYDDLYSIDLTTGAATYLGDLEFEDSAWGFAVDPTSGLLYLLTEGGELYTVDPAAVTATGVANWSFSEGASYTYGLAIDSNGTAWVVEYPGDEAYSALWSTPLATFGTTVELSGNITIGETGDDYEGWWVAIIGEPAPAPAPEPVLAATGVDVTPFAAGGLLLLAAGGVLLARRSRQA